jgi:hypothetical protein
LRTEVPTTVSTTDEAHRRALEWAHAARVARTAVLDDLAAGLVTLPAILDRCRGDDLVGRIKVLPVLEALPGTTKVGTRRVLDELGVDHATPLAELTDDQVSQILERFGSASAGTGA